MQNVISYFGGKNNIVNKILSYFPSVQSYDIYVEAFSGSGALLINKEPSKCEIYNDLDKNVYSLYKCISDKYLKKALEKKCRESIYHEDLRREYKEKLKLDGLSILERAYYFWYVARSSRNGNINSSFRVDTEIKNNTCRSTYDFINSIDTIDKLHERLKYVIFHNRSALELIEKYRTNPKAFIYLDPPYHPGTRTAERYVIDFTLDQHQKLLAMMIDKNTKAKILLSGYYHRDYEVLEKNNYKRDEFDIFLRFGKKTEANRVTENVWFNYELGQLSLFA